MNFVMCGVALALTHTTIVTQDAKTVAPRVGREVKDLHYGDVLFHFYQDDFFDSIVRFNAYRALGYEEPHSEDGQLLLGGMLLSYGQHEEAADIFHRLLDTSTRVDVRNRAWYFLARIAYEHGALDSAAKALDQIKGDLPPEFEPQRRLLLAQVLIEEQRYDDAAAMLSAWKAPEAWVPYARYNLGVAQIRGGHLDEGLQTLDAAGALPANDDEQLDVRDRVNLTLGFEQMRADRAAAAEPAFQRVRLEGPFSNKALLGIGWSESAQAQYSTALVPWMELGKRDVLDPAVEESLLAVPYAMGKLGAYGHAAAHYQDAIKAFDDENHRLDDSIARIRSGQLLNDLFSSDKAGGKPADDTNKDRAVPASGWNWQLDKLPDTPESRYLVHLLASHEFQQGLKNYRDLRFAHDNLEHWSHDVSTFSDMLNTRRLAFEQRRPQTHEALEKMDLLTVRRQRDALDERIKTIEDHHDALGLANDQELQQLDKLKSIRERLDRLGDAPEAADLKDQARLLYGVLFWNLSHDYALRLWQEKRALAELNDGLAKAEGQRDAVAAAEQAEDARLKDFAGRVDAQTPRIAQLLAANDQLMDRQQHALEDLAVTELQQYQERLRGYTIEARYALAQIYDRAATRPQTSSPDEQPVVKP